MPRPLLHPCPPQAQQLTPVRSSPALQEPQQRPDQILMLIPHPQTIRADDARESALVIRRESDHVLISVFCRVFTSTALIFEENPPTRVGGQISVLGSSVRGCYVRFLTARRRLGRRRKGDPVMHTSRRRASAAIKDRKRGAPRLRESYG
ncbi:hypothetical protein CISG_07933 [Coccidioides immitis RMSCC 3703]|uniref:Uncharacterized protein n=1 Tax=Coccidioides immitis RMSCC 3703 TaxID=454286 RepID=A0A0J8R501_COCIT|nr:hypothetical protein CISG_07933 [Coccidioides immitis RMSCC 3703]